MVNKRIVRRSRFPRSLSGCFLSYRLLILFAVILLTAGFLFPAVPIQNNALGNVSSGSARLKLITAAEAYLGVPYRYGGLDRRGMDCSGLVYASFRDALNIPVPRTAEGLFSWTERISADEIMPGDLVFFITSGSVISHVGIYTGRGLFIHAPSEGRQTGVMYSRLDESYWRRTFAGAGRALPWENNFPDNNYPDNIYPDSSPGDTVLAAAPAASIDSNTADSGYSANAVPSRWNESAGFFTGFGLTASLGGFVDYTFFRGLGFMAKAGYKGLFSTSFQIGLEFRPEWDRFLGIWRLPLTMSLGTDTFQFFIGPAYTIGEPQIKLGSTRNYYPGFTWLGELGVSWALKPIQISSGGLSFLLEMAWQPYFTNSGFDFFPDLSANLRLSLGLRYLWLTAKN